MFWQRRASAFSSMHPEYGGHVTLHFDEGASTLLTATPRIKCSWRRTSAGNKEVGAQQNLKLPTSGARFEGLHRKMQAFFVARALPAGNAQARACPGLCSRRSVAGQLNVYFAPSV